MGAEGPELSLTQHLVELRDRLVRCAITLVIATLVSLIFTDYFFKALIAPMSGDKPVFNRPTGMFTNYMKVALIGGLALAMPMLIYQMVRFVVPGLLARERKYLYFIVPMGSLSFVGGMAFAYFVMLPAGIPFLLSFGREIATPLWDIEAYISLITTLLVGVGLIFEIPLIVFILARLGIVDHRMLIRYWKLAILGCAVLAAVITPTGDPYNMALMAFPLFFLYFLSIFLAFVARPRGRRKPAEGASAGSA